ncbi:MAG: transketolase [Clostridiales bacterium]|nr:transketolase [Clostridiales bacterium]
MQLSREKLIALENKAHELRRSIVDTVYHAGSGHLGGALSMIDAVTLLYYHRMNIDRANPKWPERDRFIMSKGHAGIGFVTVLADLGYIDREDLKTFNLTGSKLGIHLDATRVPGVDASTGSLGHGLSIALGMAIAARMTGKDYITYCLLGDGECNEGAVWEAAMATGSRRQTNLITLVDRNHAMLDGNTEDVMKLEPFQDKWTAFGFHAQTVNGHDFAAIDRAIGEALARKDKPSCIILDTVKGAGVDFAAGDFRWHYGAINEELAAKANESLEKYHRERVAALEGA